MKKILLQLVILMFASTLFAQWEPINSGLEDYAPTSLWPFAEDMVLGTDGGGLYKTTDNGASWVDINGNIGNMYINDVRGLFSLTSMLIATEGGPFMTLDQVDYTNCGDAGITNNDVNYFWWGDENFGGDFMVGTNGGGVFAAEEYTGPWSPANTGLSGDGFIVNDMGGYSEDDVEFTVMATDGGTYWAVNGATEWTEKNTGLSDDALKVKRLAGLSTFILIATHGGLFYNLDLADNWEPLIPDEKLNVLFIHSTPVSPTGFMCFTFGENGFYSEDFMNWSPLDMEDISGEVTAAHANSTHVFIGVTTDGKENGGVYKKPLEQLITNINNHHVNNVAVQLNQNQPNPFNKQTKISYSLSNPGFVCLKIIDMNGKVVKTLVNKHQQKGHHSLDFEPGDLSRGMYYYTIQLGHEYSQTKKMIIK